MKSRPTLSTQSRIIFQLGWVLALGLMCFSNTTTNATIISSYSGTTDPDGPGGLPPVAVTGTYEPVQDNGFTESGMGYRVEDAATNLIGTYSHLIEDSPTQFRQQFKNFTLGNPLPGTGDNLEITVTGAFGTTTIPGDLPTFNSGPTAVSIDGTWQHFNWFPPGTTSLGGPYTFTVPAGSAVALAVTDTGRSGDIFDVRADMASLGLTSTVPANANILTPPGATGDVGFNNANFSSETFILGPGFHQIDFDVVQNSVDPAFSPGTTLSGGGFFRLTAVPEPSSTLLLALGCTLGLLRRHRVKD